MLPNTQDALLQQQMYQLAVQQQLHQPPPPIIPQPPPHQQPVLPIENSLLSNHAPYKQQNFKSKRDKSTKLNPNTTEFVPQNKRNGNNNAASENPNFSWADAQPMSTYTPSSFSYAGVVKKDEKQPVTNGVNGSGDKNKQEKVQENKNSNQQKRQKKPKGQSYVDLSQSLQVQINHQFEIGDSAQAPLGAGIMAIPDGVEPYNSTSTC